jgi:hypothetical protein
VALGHCSTATPTRRRSSAQPGRRRNNDADAGRLPRGRPAPLPDHPAPPDR